MLSHREIKCRRLRHRVSCSTRRQLYPAVLTHHGDIVVLALLCTGFVYVYQMHGTPLANCEILEMTFQRIVSTVLSMP